MKEGLTWSAKGNEDRNYELIADMIRANKVTILNLCILNRRKKNDRIRNNAN